MGMQQAGVQACVKRTVDQLCISLNLTDHRQISYAVSFPINGSKMLISIQIGNEQETQRNPSTVNGTTIEAVSSNIDDRTIHELYLWPSV